ncbi:MAG: hypothetical protein ACRC62_32425 [Microcoleus sp.]
MKLNLTLPGLLIALLVGCSNTNTVSPTASPSTTANQTSNPVESEKISTPTPTPLVSEKANKSTSISNSASSIGKAAQLTPKQIKELIEMENRLTVQVDHSNLKLEKVKAILPTYVPPGFKVDEKDFRVSVCNFPGEKSGRYSYFITYRNSSNSSFNIQTRPCGGFYTKPTIVKSIQIPSNKFAQINLKLIKFDRPSDNTEISGEIWSSNPESPGSFQNLLSLTSGGSNPINWQEAQKVIASMDYLNQN